MKRILAVLAIAFPLLACAEPKVVATSPSSVGGMLYLITGAEQCPATGMAIVAQIPFEDFKRGCITAIADQNFHVVFENGFETDYPYSGWSFSSKSKAPKGGV